MGMIWPDGVVRRFSVNRFRLRGTWEDDPAPIPFPRDVAGRDAGAGSTATRASQVPETQLSERTRELIDNVDEEIDRLQLRFDEFRHLLEAEEFEDDGPTAA
ncbi:MAG: hypothetical protein ED559_00835 [Phycisphaera sp.]|nr:MAG: hypothetical protein ED559_00835 [Phycisphaera sp.]